MRAVTVVDARISRVFAPIRTERLLLRPFVAGDALGLAARRSDPAVARYQNWTAPYPEERARAVVEGMAAMPGPADGEWWMLAISDLEAPDRVYGDLALHLTWGGRSAEIGYTLASEHWGRGFAVEAVDGLVARLFDGMGVTRVSAMLHPDNVASAQVLERTGFLFEGHTRSSYWVGDEVSDDHLYGMTRADWTTWHDRPRSMPRQVDLVEVTAGNFREVGRLATHKSQERFVAPMAASYANALFPGDEDGKPVTPWMRAVEADGELVGFVMVALVPGDEPFLWRLLIDRLHQRRGIGSRVVDLVVEECRSAGATGLVTSWGEGRGSPGPFYARLGFEPTGRHLGDEVEGRRLVG